MVYILFVSLHQQQALEYMGQWYKLCSARQLARASSQRAMAEAGLVKLHRALQIGVRYQLLGGWVGGGCGRRRPPLPPPCNMAC